MKVGFLSQPFDVPRGDRVGSVGIWTYEVGRRLVERGHEVVVWYGSWLGGGEEVEEGIRFRRVGLGGERVRRWARDRLGRVGIGRGAARFDTDGYFAGYARRAAREMGREGCDVVHVQNFMQYVPLVRRAAPGAGVILHVHCEWLTELEEGWVRERIGGADAILGCSEYVISKARGRFGALGGRMAAMANGVDVEMFRPAEGGMSRGADGERLLYVGRVSPEKGLHVLVEAMEGIVGARPGVVLDVVGPEWAPPRDFIWSVTGDEKVRALGEMFRPGYGARLRAMVAERGLEGRVRFRGVVSRGELAELYRGADVFVFPSVWEEGFGMPPVEAMASGVAVVASRSGGIPENVVDGETGVLVGVNDVEGLAGAVVGLLGDRERREAMGRAGRERAVEVYSWDSVVGRVLELYRGVGSKQ